MTKMACGCDRVGLNKFRGGRNLRGTSANRDCHRVSSRILKISTDEAFTTSSGKLTPLRGYSNAEGMLATSSITPLLVNIGSMTAKPIAGGGRKDCVPCINREGRVLFYILNMY